MKKIILMAIILISTSCKKHEFSSEFAISCKKVASSVSLYRCENQEVVCYRSYEALQCKFKENNQ